MAVAWNSTLRQNQWSNWGCSVSNAGNTCPSGYKPDTSQSRASKRCLTNKCSFSCRGDSASTPLYDRHSVLCFKESYPTDMASLWGCCSGSTMAQDCNENYYQGSPQCNNMLASNCTGEILFSNDGSSKYNACNTWCSQNKEVCDSIKKSYCNNTTNLALPVCQVFAQEVANSGDSTFDSSVQTYCASHQGEPFCGCQMRELSYAGSDQGLLKLLNAPQCYDATCINQGYENTKQISFRKNGNCPTSICSNSVNVSNVSSSNIKNIIASCDSSSNASTSTTTNTTQNQSNSVSSPEIVDDTSIISAGNILLFLIAMIFIYIFGFASKVSVGGVEYSKYANEFIN
jgi:hypothetical protein